MNNDEHKILKTIGRILLLIILTATIAGVVCLVFNLLDELSAINKAAQTNQGNVGEMWANFSIRKEYFWTKPEQLEVSDLFLIFRHIFGYLCKNITTDRNKERLQRPRRQRQMGNKARA